MHVLWIVVCPFGPFLLAIVLSVLLRFTIVVCPFGPFLLAIVLSVLLRFTASDYPFGIFKLIFIAQTCLNSQTIDVVVWRRHKILLEVLKQNTDRS